MLDNVKYNSKPSVNEVKFISNRVISNPVDLSPQQLEKEIVSGKSFVAGYLNKKVNGEIKRRIDNWSSQQVICLDFDTNYRIDEAIDEFKDKALFIYTTFNHTNEYHRIRVVLALDEPIYNYNIFKLLMNELHELYPQCDKSCKDGSRLFYGGRESIVFDYNNRIKLNDYINTNKPSNNKAKMVEGVLGGHNRFNKNILLVPPSKSLINKGNNEHLEWIKGGKPLLLQQSINPKPVTFYTYTEAMHYLNNVDLEQFLGMDSSPFSCIFHSDDNPSANVFYASEAEANMYKCFSDKCTFKAGMVRKIVERLQGCNKVEALKFLLEVYKVTIAETDWQKQQKEIIDENIRYLKSNDFAFEYPELKVRIGRYIPDLILLHTIAKDNLPAEHYNEEQIEFLFYASMRHLANIKGLKNHKRISDIVALFVYLGLIFRKRKDELPSDFLKDAKRNLSQKDVDLISFFALPSYSDNVMSYGEEKAIQFKDNHLTMKAWSKDLLNRTLGEDEANRVYPSKFKNSSENKAVKEDSISIMSSIFEKEIFTDIEINGYAIERDVMDRIKASDNFKKKHYGLLVGEIVNKYGLDRVRLNKKLKSELGLGSMSGYPMIIIREG